MPKAFISGDIEDMDVDAGSWGTDATMKIYTLTGTELGSLDDDGITYTDGGEEVVDEQCKLVIAGTTIAIDAGDTLTITGATMSCTVIFEAAITAGGTYYFDSQGILYNDALLTDSVWDVIGVEDELPFGEEPNQGTELVFIDNLQLDERADPAVSESIVELFDLTEIPGVGQFMSTNESLELMEWELNKFGAEFVEWITFAERFRRSTPFTKHTSYTMTWRRVH